MATRLRDMVDIYFSETGDIYVGSDNDIEDTKNYFYRALIQKIDTVIKSSKGDWSTQPQVGANITSALGRKNNAITGNLIKQKIDNQLRQEELLKAGEYTLDVFPTSATSIAIGIKLFLSRTGSPITLVYSYDTRDNKLMLRGA